MGSLADSFELQPANASFGGYIHSRKVVVLRHVKVGTI
jgi:hypothetical protein